MNVRYYLPYEFKVIFVIAIFGVKTPRFFHINVMLLWALFYNITCTRKSVNYYSNALEFVT